MTFLGNVIWLIFGGFISGMGYIIGGLGTCLTIIGIPFGIEAMKLGLATFTPFGKEVVKNSNADTPLALLLNLIWIVLFGWEIALSHLLFGAILAITVIGLPFAKQHFKLVTMALWPFGHDLVAPDVR